MIPIVSTAQSRILTVVTRTIPGREDRHNLRLPSAVSKNDLSVFGQIGLKIDELLA